jgi:hypothetical protein
MVGLVETMLKLHKDLPKAKPPVAANGESSVKAMSSTLGCKLRSRSDCAEQQ